MPISVAPRDPERVIVDAFLALCAANVMGQKKGSPGKTVSQKVMFSVQLRLGQRSSPTYCFIRHHFGPYSPDLDEDLRGLVARGLLRSSSLITTDRGSRIVRALRSELEAANGKIFSALDQEASKRARWTAARAKAEAYDVPVQVAGGPLSADRTVPIRDLPTGTALRFPDLPAEELRVDRETLQELAFELSMSAEDVARSRRFPQQATEHVSALLDL